MGFPHGDDTGGGFEAGRDGQLKRQEGKEESADHGDMDHQMREDSVKMTNNWIKGGEKI